MDTIKDQAVSILAHKMLNCFFLAASESHPNAQSRSLYTIPYSIYGIAILRSDGEKGAISKMDGNKIYHFKSDGDITGHFKKSWRKKWPLKKVIGTKLPISKMDGDKIGHF